MPSDAQRFMKHEVRSIPPAPRRLRLRPLFAHRWLLFGLGAAFVVIGGLAAWLMFLQSGGVMSRGPRLDQGPSTRVTGTLRKVAPPRLTDGRQDVVYEFRVQVNNQMANGFGSCSVAASSWKVGDEVPVDVLLSDPNINRIPGGILHVERDWLRAQFWITGMAVPGVLLLLAWLAGVVQLRHVLVHGDASTGVVHRVLRVPFVLPEMLRVDYTFRDHRAKVRHNHHWVRVHGELGARLLQQMQQNHYEEMPVLHDRRLPQWNRMVLPQDFLPQPAVAPPAADRLS